MEEGVAIPLIIHQEREGFKLNPEAIDLLRSIDKKIGVISVAGKYRTGKSYLLNKIILKLKGQGFGVGPSINPCTKGIWIYNKPIDITTADGENISLLILDSEGLGAFDEDSNHDTKIFMLAVLLSSFFIYNSVGSIDENALNNLSLVVSLTKNLQIRASDSELDVDEVASYFPTFLWVLRDFALQLIDGSGNAINPKEYLENSLMPQKGMSDAVEAKNRVRRLLKHFFKDRDCFVLVRPSEDERTLQNLQNVDQEDLRPEFVRQTEMLRKNIYRKVKVKTLNGRALTGKMLADITISYIEAINKGAVPTIEGAWQSVVSSECNKQIDLATSEYDKELKSAITVELLDEKGMKRIHKGLKAKALRSFKDKAVGDELTPYIQALKKKILERFTLLKSQNDRKLVEKCQEACQELTIEFEDKLRTGEFNDFQIFKREFERRLGELRKQMPAGEIAELKLKEMSANLLTDAADYISRNALLEQRNSNRRLLEQIELIKANLDSKKDDFAQEKDYFKSRLQEAESENFQLKASAASLEMRLEEMRGERDRMNQTYEQRLESMKGDYKDRFGENKEKYEQVSKQFQELQGKYNVEINNLQKDLALARQELEWKSKELEQLKFQRDSQDAGFKDLRVELRKAKEELEEKEDQVKSIKSAAKAAPEPSSEWLSERNILINQLESLKLQVEENKSVKEALVAALQSRNYEQSDSKDPSKHLTIALEKTEDRCQELEQKVLRLKRFQKIFQVAFSMQCKLCGKSFASNLISNHIPACEETFSLKSKRGEYVLIITQIKSCEETMDQRGGVEYCISVTYKGRTWSIQKVFKHFKALESSLQKELPEADVPDSALLYPKDAGAIFSSKPSPMIEERKKRFQEYLTRLSSDPKIRQSKAFRKFLSTDQYFPEEF